MKLIDHTLIILSVILFFAVSAWAVLFYFQLINQIKSTVDEGLANTKIVIIDKIKNDKIPVEKNEFNDNNYTLTWTSQNQTECLYDISNISVLACPS